MLQYLIHIQLTRYVDANAIECAGKYDGRERLVFDGTFYEYP